MIKAVSLLIVLLIFGCTESDNDRLKKMCEVSTVQDYYLDCETRIDNYNETHFSTVCHFRSNLSIKTDSSNIIECSPYWVMRRYGIDELATKTVYACVGKDINESINGCIKQLPEQLAKEILIKTEVTT